MAGKSYHFYKYILFRHQSLIRANARIRMTCDLTNGELVMLNVLYTKRNFKPNATYNSEKLKWIFSKKYTQDFDKALKHLKNQGYISSIKKADDKIYISDYKKMAVALTAHGYTVTTGRERPI
jgi:hypothetical protein